MADIINSLKVANKLHEAHLKEEVIQGQEKNPSSIRFDQQQIPFLEELGWTQDIRNSFINKLQNGAPQYAAKNQGKRGQGGINFKTWVIDQLLDFYQNDLEKMGYIVDVSKDSKKAKQLNALEQGERNETKINIVRGASYFMPIIKKPANLPAVINDDVPATIEGKQVVVKEENGVPMVVDPSQPPAVQDERTSEDVDSIPGKGENNFIIFPLNPFLPGSNDFNTIDAELKKYQDCFPIVMLSDQGADGAFDVFSFVSYKNHKSGLSTKFNKYATLTSFKTFTKVILNNLSVQESTNNNINSPRNKTLDKILKEAEGQEVTVGNNPNSRQNVKTEFKGVSFANGFKIVATSDYLAKMGPNSEFSQILKINWTDNTHGKILGKINITLEQFNANVNNIRNDGKTVFNSILEYVNGKKSGSASKRGTDDTATSQRINESKLKEAGGQQADWSWESLKINMGAKEYLDRLFSSVQSIKKGLDDGGNPNLCSRITKNVLAQIGKSWGAALMDAGDLGLEGIGLGWMLPLVKAGIEEFDKEKNNKEYEGIEAWVRDPSFAEISHLFGNPKDFIEDTKHTGN